MESIEKKYNHLINDCESYFKIAELQVTKKDIVKYLEQLQNWNEDKFKNKSLKDNVRQHFINAMNT